MLRHIWALALLVQAKPFYNIDVHLLTMKRGGRNMARRGISWAAEVLKRIRGLDFPVKKDVLKERLKDVYWRGIPLTKILDEIPKDEFESPAELLHEISEAIRRLEERGEIPVASKKGINWAVEVLKRIRGLDFPVKKEVIAERLKDLYWMGIPMSKILDEVKKDEFESPAELLHELAEAIRRLEERGEAPLGE